MGVQLIDITRPREERETIEEKKKKKVIKAVKKAAKEFLIGSGIGISLGLTLFYTLGRDTGEDIQKENVKMIQAIGGDYYYPEDQYEDYLKERELFIEQEENKDENCLLQNWTRTENLRN